MAAAILCGGGPLRAVTTLVYSFENQLPGGPDGFFGLGATVTQDTLGATHSAHSMKYAIGVGGFVGARTELIPPVLNDPPGVTHVLFDLTITEAYTDSFADIGVTVFGHALNADPAQFGLQVQFADQVELAGLAPGTYTDRQITLDSSVGPYRSGESFDDIFGDGEEDLTVASEFQFFINKNTLTPLTVYIDNVRLVTDPTADLQIVKNFSPTQVTPGEQSLFTLGVQNHGPDTALDTTVTDVLPPGLTYVSDDCGAAFAAPVLTWEIGDLPDQAIASCQVIVVVTATATNEASVSTSSDDPNDANDTASDTILAVAEAIPTLGSLAVLALVLMLAGAGIVALRRG
jgi:uncharacterized repeat protein (TIGR01451 family)